MDPELQKIYDLMYNKMLSVELSEQDAHEFAMKKVSEKLAEMARQQRSGIETGIDKNSPPSMLEYASYAGMQTELLQATTVRGLKPISFTAGELFEEKVSARINEIRQEMAAQGMDVSAVPEPDIPKFVKSGTAFPGMRPDWMMQAGEESVVGEHIWAAGPLETQTVGIQKHLRGQISAYIARLGELTGQNPGGAYYTLPLEHNGESVPDMMARAEGLLAEHGDQHLGAHQIIDTLATVAAEDIVRGRFNMLPKELVVSPANLTKEEERIKNAFAIAKPRAEFVAKRVIPGWTQGKGLTQEGYRLMQERAEREGVVEPGESIRSTEGTIKLMRPFFGLLAKGKDKHDAVREAVTDDEVFDLIAKDFAMTTGEMQAQWQKAVGSGAVVAGGPPGERYRSFREFLYKTRALGYGEVAATWQEKKGGKGDQSTPPSLSGWINSDIGFRAVLANRVTRGEAEKFKNRYKRDPSEATNTKNPYMVTANDNVVPVNDLLPQQGFGRGLVIKSPDGKWKPAVTDEERANAVDEIVGPLAPKTVKRLKQTFRGLDTRLTPGRMVDGEFVPEEELTANFVFAKPRDRREGVQVAPTGYRGNFLFTKEELWGPGTAGLNPNGPNTFARRKQVTFSHTGGIDDIIIPAGSTIDPKTSFSWTEGGKSFSTGDMPWRVLEYRRTPEQVEHINRQTGQIEYEEVEKWTALVDEMLSTETDQPIMPHVTFKSVAKWMGNRLREGFIPFDEAKKQLDFIAGGKITEEMPIVMNLASLMSEEELAARVPNYKPGMAWEEMALHIFGEGDEAVMKKWFDPYAVTFHVPRIVDKSRGDVMTSQFHLVNPHTLESFYEDEPDEHGNLVPKAIRPPNSPGEDGLYRPTPEEIFNMAARPIEGQPGKYAVITKHFGYNIPQMYSPGIDYGARHLRMQWNNLLEIGERNPGLIRQAAGADRFSRYQAGQTLVAAGLNAGAEVATPGNIATLEQREVTALFNAAESISTAMAPEGQVASRALKEKTLFDILERTPRLQNRILRLNEQAGGKEKTVYAPSLQAIMKHTYETDTGEAAGSLLTALYDTFQEIARGSEVRRGVADKGRLSGVQRLEHYTEELALFPSTFVNATSSRMPQSFGRTAAMSLALGPNEVYVRGAPLLMQTSRVPGNPQSYDPTQIAKNVAGTFRTEFADSVAAMNPEMVWIGNGDNDGDTWYFWGHPDAIMVSSDGRKMTQKVVTKTGSGDGKNSFVGSFQWVDKPKSGPLAHLTSGTWAPTRVDENGDFVYEKTTQAGIMKGVEMASVEGGSGSPYEDFRAFASSAQVRDTIAAKVRKIAPRPAQEWAFELSERSAFQDQIGKHYNPWYSLLPGAARMGGADEEMLAALDKGAYAAYGKAQGPSAVKGPLNSITAAASLSILRWGEVDVKQYDFIGGWEATAPFLGRHIPEQSLSMKEAYGRDMEGNEIPYSDTGGIMGLAMFTMNAFSRVKHFDGDPYLAQKGMTAKAGQRMFTPRERALLFSPIGAENYTNKMELMFTRLDEVLDAGKSPEEVMNAFHDIRRSLVGADDFEGLFAESPIGTTFIGSAIQNAEERSLGFSGEQLGEYYKARNPSGEDIPGFTVGRLLKHIGNVMKSRQEDKNYNERIPWGSLYQSKKMLEPYASDLITPDLMVVPNGAQSELGEVTSLVDLIHSERMQLLEGVGGLPEFSASAIRARYQPVDQYFRTEKVKKGKFTSSADLLASGSMVVDLFNHFLPEYASVDDPFNPPIAQLPEGLVSSIETGEQFDNEAVLERANKSATRMWTQLTGQVQVNRRGESVIANVQIPQGFGFDEIPLSHVTATESALRGLGIKPLYRPQNESQKRNGLVNIFGVLEERDYSQQKTWQELAEEGPPKLDDEELQRSLEGVGDFDVDPADMGLDFDLPEMKDDGGPPPRNYESGEETIYSGAREPSGSRRVAIVGSRSYRNYKHFSSVLDEKLKEYGNDIEIVSGGARGADSMAERYARERKMKFKKFSADWGGPKGTSSFKPDAGDVRNKQMADYATDVLAFWDYESSGTGHMLDEALTRKKPHTIIDVRPFIDPEDEDPNGPLRVMGSGGKLGDPTGRKAGEDGFRENIIGGDQGPELIVPNKETERIEASLGENPDPERIADAVERGTMQGRIKPKAIDIAHGGPSRTMADGGITGSGHRKLSDDEIQFPDWAPGGKVLPEGEAEKHGSALPPEQQGHGDQFIDELSIGGRQPEEDQTPSVLGSDPAASALIGDPSDGVADSSGGAGGRIPPGKRPGTKPSWERQPRPYDPRENVNHLGIAEQGPGGEIRMLQFFGSPKEQMRRLAGFGSLISFHGQRARMRAQTALDHLPGVSRNEAQRWRLTKWDDLVDGTETGQRLLLENHMLELGTEIGLDTPDIQALQGVTAFVSGGEQRLSPRSARDIVKLATDFDRMADRAKKAARAAVEEAEVRSGALEKALGHIDAPDTVDDLNLKDIEALFGHGSTSNATSEAGRIARADNKAKAFLDLLGGAGDPSVDDPMAVARKKIGEYQEYYQGVIEENKQIAYEADLHADGSFASGIADNLNPLAKRASMSVAVTNRMENMQESILRQHMTDRAPSAEDIEDTVKRANAAIKEFGEVVETRGTQGINSFVDDLQDTRQRLRQEMDEIQYGKRGLSAQIENAKYEASTGWDLKENRPLSAKEIEDRYGIVAEASHGMGVLAEAEKDVQRKFKEAQGQLAEAQPTLRQSKRNFMTANIMQHVLWLPWQMDMAKQFGGQQRAEALQYAAQVDALGFQEGYWQGEPQRSDSYVRGLSETNNQAWAQYYSGQGASQSGSMGSIAYGFLASHPDVARTIGQYEGYGSMIATASQAEIMTRYITQGLPGGSRGLFFGGGSVLSSAGKGIVNLLGGNQTLLGGAALGAMKFGSSMAVPAAIAAATGVIVSAETGATASYINKNALMPQGEGFTKAETAVGMLGIVEQSFLGGSPITNAVFPKLSQQFQARNETMSPEGFTNFMMARQETFNNTWLGKALGQPSLYPVGMAQAEYLGLVKDGKRTFDPIEKGSSSLAEALQKDLEGLFDPAQITQLAGFYSRQGYDLKDHKVAAYLIRKKNEEALGMGQDLNSVIGMPVEIGESFGFFGKTNSEFASSYNTQTHRLSPMGKVEFGESFAGSAQLMGDFPRMAGWGPGQTFSTIAGISALPYNQRSIAAQRITGSTEIGYNLGVRSGGFQINGKTVADDPSLSWLDPVTFMPLNYEMGKQIEWQQRAQDVTMQGIGFRQTAYTLAQSNPYQQGTSAYAQRQLENFSIATNNQKSRFSAQLNIDQLQLQADRMDASTVDYEAESKSRGLNRQMFENSVKWRTEDINTNIVRGAIQRQWQIQDFSVQSNKFELQQGWQLYDYDEAIRYASGRDRIRLERQKERSVTMANIDRTQMSEQEARAATQYGWSEEDAQKQLKRLGEETDIRKQLLDIDDERAERQKEFIERQADLTKQSLAQAKIDQASLEADIGLTKTVTDARRADEDAQRGFATERYEAEKTFFDDMTPKLTEYWQLTDEIEKKQQLGQLHMAGMYEQFETMWENYISEGSSGRKDWESFWQPMIKAMEAAGIPMSTAVTSSGVANRNATHRPIQHAPGNGP